MAPREMEGREVIRQVLTAVDCISNANNSTDHHAEIGHAIVIVLVACELLGALVRNRQLSGLRGAITDVDIVCVVAYQYGLMYDKFAQPPLARLVDCGCLVAKVRGHACVGVPYPGCAVPGGYCAQKRRNVLGADIARIAIELFHMDIACLEASHTGKTKAFGDTPVTGKATFAGEGKYNSTWVDVACTSKEDLLATLIEMVSGQGSLHARITCNGACVKHTANKDVPEKDHRHALPVSRVMGPLEWDLIW
jgi:hypothetical protein